MFDSLAKDPANAKYIAAIRELKAKTPASPGAAACQASSTAAGSIPDVQLKLVRTIDGGANPFAHPNSLAIDSQGNLYIMMNLTNQIQVFDPNGKFLRMWGKTGSGNGEFNFFTQNPLNEGGAIAMGPNDTLYVADTFNNRVQAFKPDGTYIGQWGSAGQKDGQFLSPVYIAVDPQGNVSVLDGDLGTIQTFDANGKFLSKITGQDYGGGHLNALVIASDGTMYVSDTTAPRIMVFKAGKHSGDIKVDNQYVNGTADKKGNFFMTTDGQVVKFDASGKPVYQFTGISVPSAVAAGANGLVYLSDIDTNTVKVFQEP